MTDEPILDSNDQYLVGVFLCKSHSWKAFRDPQERDCMQPCILAPVYAIEASTKREAVAEAERRHEADALTRREHSESGER